MSGPSPCLLPPRTCHQSSFVQLHVFSLSYSWIKKFSLWCIVPSSFAGFQVTCPQCKSEFHLCASGPTSQAIISTLDETWSSLLLKAWAPSSIRSYSSAQRQFIAFCSRFLFYNDNSCMLPASELTILRFIAFISSRLSLSSVRNHISAVRNLHIICGFKDPLEDCPCVPLVICGLKRFQGERARKKSPITALVLFSIKLQLDFTLFDHVMFWAACCLAFFGFLRCSEFTVPASGFRPNVHLSVSDVQVDKIPVPDNLMINIKCSKRTNLVLVVLSLLPDLIQSCAQFQLF